jgi:hypothetical protein
MRDWQWQEVGARHDHCRYLTCSAYKYLLIRFHSATFASVRRLESYQDHTRLHVRLCVPRRENQAKCPVKRSIKQSTEFYMEIHHSLTLNVSSTSIVSWTTSDDVLGWLLAMTRPVKIIGVRAKSSLNDCLGMHLHELADPSSMKSSSSENIIIVQC